MPPPVPDGALFPLMVLLLIVTVPKPMLACRRLSQSPLFPLMVLLLIVTVPPLLKRPPPSPKRRLFPLIVLWLIVSCAVIVDAAAVA